MSTISASTTSTTAYKVTADTTGALVFQTGATPTTAMTIDTSQNTTLAGTLTTSAKGIATASLPAGAVLQVVQGTYSTFTSIASATITDTGLSASITPSSASSKVLVLVNICGIYTAVGSCYARFLIVRGSTSLINFGTASGYGTSGGVGGSDAGAYLDSPATTSSTTYKIQWNRQGSGTVNMNNTVSEAPTAGTSTITLMEIAA